MIKYQVLFALLSLCKVNSNATSTCSQTVISTSYLDIAVDMILKAKYSTPTCNNCEENSNRRALDCADLLIMGHNKSGVYEIWPINRVTGKKSLNVYCDMETDGGGWTLLQRRGDFKRPNDYFYKDWKSYKEGFGDVEKDIWIGNDNIFALSNQKLYSVRFDLNDVEGNKRYALYDKFWIDDETHKYKLHISDFSGDAGDSMTLFNDENNLNNQKFSTRDQDNDQRKEHSCSELYKGGWWYNGCHQSNLNGLYLKGKHDTHANGVNWNTWKGYNESLEWTEIKIRPKNFRSSSKATPM